jgi:hypothetical protein
MNDAKNTLKNAPRSSSLDNELRIKADVAIDGVDIDPTVRDIWKIEEGRIL